MADATHDEQLRGLERRAQEVNDAATWSRLAFALSRAARSGDAQAAAHRALMHDPADASRSLLPPRTGGRLSDDVRWPGLRRLASPRRIALRDGLDYSCLDVGGGVLVYESTEHIVAFDVFTESPLWIHRRTGRASSGQLATAGSTVAQIRDISWDTPREGSLLLTLLDKRSGELAGAPAVVRLPDVEARTDSPYITPRALGPLDDDRFVIVLSVSSADLPNEWLLLAVDRTGRLLWQKEVLAERCPLLAVLAARIILIDRQTVRAFSFDGVEAWRLGGVTLLAAREDRLLIRVSKRNESALSWIGASSGDVLSSRPVGSLRPFMGVSTVPGVVVNTETEIVALEGEAFRVAWRASMDAPVLAATADTVLAIRKHPYDYRRDAPLLFEELASVVALDAETGAELSRIEIPPTGERSPDAASDRSIGVYPQLAGGKLIFPSANGRPNLFVLGEP